MTTHKNVVAQLAKDPILKKALHELKPLSLPASPDLFNELVKSITYQQISWKAADVIYSRFVKMMGTENFLPSDILSFGAPVIKIVGFSRPKSQYITNIAKFFEENNLYGFNWETKTDDEIIAQLTQIKGVGEWTVQMILMFQLLRPDVFPVKDYGIQMAMKSLYGLKEEKSALLKKLIKISDAWKPYRSFACRYLWSWKRENP